MRRARIVALLVNCAGSTLAIMLLWAHVAPLEASEVGSAMPLEGLLEVNGVRLEYLDWGGSGPVLLMVPGLGDDPRVFQQLAAELGKEFRVVSYARRGFGESEGNGPYDLQTLTEDLKGVMDALGIEQASLIGVSAGGDEVTHMAVRYPARARAVIYLEAAYDWTQAEFGPVVKAAPPVTAFSRPASAMASLQGFLTYQHDTWYPDLLDMHLIEPLLRAKIVIHGDGSLADRTPAERAGAHLAALMDHPAKDYRALQCPALAVYVQSFYDLDIRDTLQHERIVAWEHHSWQPFQAKSLARVREQLPQAQVVHLPGAHVNFLVMEPKAFAQEIRQFLRSDASASRPARIAQP